MAQDIEFTRVIFKREGDDVVAFFPQEVGTSDPYTCACFAHVGQHGSASVSYAAGLRPAKPEDCADLIRELEADPYGYRLQVARKFTSRDLGVRRDKLAC